MNTYIYKVVLLGNHEVGKTTLFRKLKGDAEWLEASNSKSSRFADSLNLDPCNLEFKLKDEPAKILLEVTDTGSVERFRGSIPTNYFRHSQGVVLVYDVTEPTSLYDLEDWMTDAYNKVPDGAIIDYALIGNKLDQAGTGMDPESFDDGKCFAERHNIPEALQFKIAASNDSVESLRAVFKTVALHIHKTQTHALENHDSDNVVLVEETEIPLDQGKGCAC